ncbi:MAG: hypothetical protein J6Z31_05610 [Fibrobacter sp.]|nr:hypothetical protein [Fibrobacter sp.]
MKKSLSYLLALGTVALTACSSMDVSSSEAIEGNFPSDFVAVEYMNLHPGLRSLQIQDYVKEYNAAQVLDADSVAADSVDFLADTAKLHQIYVNPFYAGYNETLWEEDWAVSTTPKMTCGLDTVYVRVKPADETPVTVYLGSLTYAEDGKTITAVTGYTDSTKTTEVSYEIDGTAYSIVNQLGSTKTVVDSSDCVTTIDSTAGGIPSDKRKQLMKFNFKNTRDDLTALQALPIDTFAISSQYLMYGQAHGWAYRACNETEKANPIQSEVYPMTKLYCADDDVVREIAE